MCLVEIPPSLFYYLSIVILLLFPVLKDQHTIKLIVSLKELLNGLSGIADSAYNNNWTDTHGQKKINTDY